ncbi:MAG TPA: hypothetical protein VGL81_23630 [Polyangiaceae bacterium]|jgi:hypothetical protein
MHARALIPVPCLLFFAACSSSSPSPSASGGGGGGGNSGPTVTEHGIVYDYGTLLASGTLATVEGLTVTDGDETTTTDAQGTWSLAMPLGATMAPIVTGTSKGDVYSLLMFPAATAAGADLDWGNIIIPDQSTFSLEQVTLGSTSTDAIVHVVAVAQGACTTLAGGTLTVTSPPGAKVNYFDAQGYPSATQTAMVDPPVPQRPVADIYDVAPGAQISFTLKHPSCHLAPYPVTFNGGTFSGQVTTKAAEPGDNNSAMNIILQ